MAKRFGFDDGRDATRLDVVHQATYNERARHQRIRSEKINVVDDRAHRVIEMQSSESCWLDAKHRCKHAPVISGGEM